MKLTAAQEKVFEIFDRVIDEGGDVWRAVQDNEALRRRVGRVFNNIGGRSKNQSALYLYGFDDFYYPITPIEYQRCWEVSDKGVFINKEYVRELSALSNQSVKDILLEANKFKKDAYEEFISIYAHSDDSYTTTLTSFKDKFPHVYNYIRSEHNKAHAFYDYFNINPLLTYYNVSHNRNLLTSLGILFEELVRVHILPDAEYQTEYKDCRPDFIINGKWVDIKLSKSTVLANGDMTIKKYLNHVNSFEVIYAVEDAGDVSFYEDNGFIKFTHVSKFYNNLDDEVILMFDEFISNASNFKNSLKAEEDGA